MPAVFVGPLERIAEQLLARRDRYGFSSLVVPDSRMEALAPLVEQLTGR
jgi:hypothetical protein